MARRLLNRPGLPLIVLVALLLSGCLSASREDRALQERTGLEVSAAQLRVQVRTLARPFSGVIEGAADRIALHAQTPEERIIALRLKINGIPAMHGALFEANPVGALFEAAALLVQMQLYVDEGPGRDIPELVRSEARAAIEEMKARLRLVGASIGVSPEASAEFWAKAEGWAREHPVKGSLVARETTQTLFADYIGSSGGGLRSMAVRLEESVQDITLRFDLYAEYIAKQARWQAELLLEEALVRDLPHRLLEEAGPISVDLEPVLSELGSERAIVLEALAAERALVLQWARAERLETLDFVRAEREAVAGLVGQELEVALDALRAERQAVLEAVDRQRVAAAADLEGVLSRAITASRREVVDHAVLRLAQLLAVVLPLVFLGALALVWYARRPR